MQSLTFHQVEQVEEQRAGQEGEQLYSRTTVPALSLAWLLSCRLRATRVQMAWEAARMGFLASARGGSTAGQAALHMYKSVRSVTLTSLISSQIYLA